MQQYRHPDYTLLILKKGEELVTALETYAQSASLPPVWLNAIGGASRVTLGFYDLATKTYEWHEFNEPLEIVGLQGNVVYVEGKPVWHIHGTFARRDLSVIGGHIKSCEIGLTGEVFLRPLHDAITRGHDEETGLELICPFKAPPIET